jgi:hypothetical protein
MSTSIAPPALDTRTYQDLLNEALARIPIHNPEWTNFNRSDPGVTLLELFAFLTESLLYRANQIPERNRLAFLSLLGVPPRPASSARGVVVFANEAAPQQTITLPSDVEARAGQVAFRTESGLDILPIETAAYYKVPLVAPPQQLVQYYSALYASYTGSQPDAATLQLYETVAVPAPLENTEQPGVDLMTALDQSLWIALLLRRADGVGDARLAAARAALAGRTLSLGVVPVLENPAAQVSPAGSPGEAATSHLDYQLPRVAADGSLGATPAERLATYRSLDQASAANVLAEPGIVQLTLPEAGALGLWRDIEPLEAGVGDLPPALEDSALGERLITWLRIQASGGSHARLLWTGVNAVMVSQEARVVGEVLPNGTGAPDQSVQLSQSPVLAETVRLRVGDPPVTWSRIEEMYAAGPEVPVPDPRMPPGTPPAAPADPLVFTIDSLGLVSCGDGLHGARWPTEAPLRADYSYSAGTAGNVGPNAISSSAALPAGIKVTNPVRTSGGADAASIEERDQEVVPYLRHRDRLVSPDDFEAIVRRTPGVDVGRVDVIPAYNPELAPNSPGDAPGAVTLMLIPRVDAVHPQAPQPDRLFLDTVCAYIDPRRIVTTEVFLRGPTYVPVWISVGFDPLAGASLAEVRDAVKAALLQFLAPLGTEGGQQPPAASDASFAHAATGWPRLKPVVPLELLAVASRVPGVDLVRPVLVAAGDAPGSETEPISMTGLELPVVAGISVLAGEPLPLDQLRGLSPSATPATNVVPVPTIPETC